MKKILFVAALASEGLARAFVGSLSTCTDSCSGHTGVCVGGCATIIPCAGIGVCALGAVYVGYGAIKRGYNKSFGCYRPKKLKMERGDNNV